jgi:hypothetical protein
VVNGLKAEICTVTGLEPSAGTCSIYEDDRHLVGQSFIFQSELDKIAADRLIELGFRVMEYTGDNVRIPSAESDPTRGTTPSTFPLQIFHVYSKKPQNGALH